MRLHTHIVEKLKDVSALYKQCLAKWNEMAQMEQEIERDEAVFKEVLSENSERIVSHTKEHAKIKAKVQEIGKEFKEGPLTEDFNVALAEIQLLSRQKEERRREIDELEEYERFLLLCAERHFDSTGRKEVDSLVDKYYVSIILVEARGPGCL